MPVCVSCAYPAEHLYTTYRTKSNIRLGVCARCDAFLDPLIEHPGLLILLDLILLKPRVYLHLMFNRGHEPLSADQAGTQSVKDSSNPKARDKATTPFPDDTRGVARRRKRRRDVISWDMVRLGLVTILAETAVRWMSSINPQPGAGWGSPELVAQHAVTLILGLAVLWWRGWYPARNKAKSSERDGRQENFLPALIPLTVLYTSLLPLILQLVLSIWYTPQSSIHESVPSLTSSIPADGTVPLPFPDFLARFLLDRLPPTWADTLREVHADMSRAWVSADRVWAGTRLLGGMAAGFGLRVILPTRPWETMGIVLAGWAAGAGW
ncbi:hypothetical protein EHS25_007573 [Saitozyma podzolica]|uniref:Protein ARV n=1 Tax=Saitozyma podzolica TaxID=1890683 RepID=A0A427YQ71_9TREE|nr:hypothetical protein EHS25_007573 [Saitozyma podzolica]